MKFYPPIYFVLLMCISIKMSAQVECDPVATTTFSVLMPNDSSDTRQFLLIDGLAASNGEYVGVGILMDGANSDLYFIRLDSSGNHIAPPSRLIFYQNSNSLNFIWQFNPTERKALHLIETFNNGGSSGYALAGTVIATSNSLPYALIASLNHAGSVLWSKMSDQPDTGAVDLLQRNDNGNLLMLTSRSNQYYTHIFLLEISKLGNWMDEESYYTPSPDGVLFEKFHPTAMTQYQAVNQTNMVIVGNYEDIAGEKKIGVYIISGPDNKSAYPLFSQIDMIGNSLTDEPIPQAVVVNGNEIVLAGEIRLNDGSNVREGMLLSISLPDENGILSLNWAKRFWKGNDPLGLSGGHRLLDLKADNSGDLFASANSLFASTPGAAVPYLMKCNATGNLQWAKTFNIPGQNYAYPLTLDISPDGGLWAGGIAFTQNNPSKMFEVKTDATGNLANCDCFNPYTPPVADYSPTIHIFDYVTSETPHVGVSHISLEDTVVNSTVGYCDQHEPNAASACEINACQSNILDISTGINHQSGQPYQPGTYDAYWKLIVSPNNSISTPRPAFVVTPHPAWDDLPSGPTATPQYLSAYPLSAYTTNNPAPALPYTFNTCFCACEDSAQVSIDLSAYADDKAEVYLADMLGVPIQGLLSVTRTSPYAFDAPPLDTLISITLEKGNYCINVDLRNTDGVAMGFSLLGTVSGASMLSHKCCNAGSTITGTKYNDRNCNGQQDNANNPASATYEKGLPDWQIQLCDESGNVLESTITDGLGFYSFNNLQPGVYTVKESQQAQWKQTEPSVTGTYTISIDSVEVAGFIDFGNRFVGPLSFIDSFECVTKSNPVIISWQGGECECMANITLLDCSTGAIQDIALNVPNSGSYIWTPPLSLLSGNYQISIALLDGQNCTATNAISTCFNVENGQPPLVICPSDITLSTDMGSCENATFQLEAPVFNTNCPCDEPSFTHVPNGYYGPYKIGENTYTVQVNDECGSNLCLVTVTVQDLEPPLIQGCPDNITIVAPTGSNGSAVTWTMPTIADNCQIASLNCSHNPGDFFECGTTEVTCIATDINGNLAICAYNITVQCDSFCCTDTLSFNQQFAQGFTPQRYDCGILLTPRSLDNCQKIWVDWGDGSTSLSTNGSEPLSHDYSTSGDYEVCLAAWEIGISGDTCAFRDTCWTVCLSCDACSNPYIKSEWSQFPASSPLFKNGSNSHFFISPADNNGDLYVTGSFRGVFQGSGLDNNTGTDEGFVAKYDASGNLMNGAFPPFSFGSDDGNDVGTVIKGDGGNGFFLAGMYAQPFQLPSPGNPSQAMTLPDEQNDVLIHANGFLAHYTDSLTGQLLDWAISVDGVDVQLNAISVISPIDAVFTGLFNNTTKFALHDSFHNGMPLHTIPGGSGAFVAKFNRLTNTILVSTFDSTAHGLGVAVHENVIYVAGDFYPPGIVFNNGGTLIESTLVNSVNPTPFVAILDSNLGLVSSFAIQEPSKLNTGSAWDIEANDNGVYVVGSYADNVIGVDFDPSNCGTFNDTIPDGGGNFLARYNSDGCLEKWTKPLYPTGFHELELDSKGMVYVVGNKGGATMHLSIYDKDCQLVKSIEPQSSSGDLTQAWSVAPIPYSKDFAVIGRFSGHQFDADPTPFNVLEFSGLPATDTATIFIGKYSCVCPNPTPEICCENLEVVVNGDSDCCYSADLINNTGFGITKVEAVLLNSDWGFVNVTPENGFSETHTAHSIVLTFPIDFSGNIATDALQFCLDDLNSNASGFQSIIFTWYETRADGTEKAICRDTVYTDCIPNNCCTDYQGFMDKVNSGFDFNFNPADCSISVTPNSLDSCQQVLSWSWGDGNTSTGPFPFNASVNHHYDYNSDFIVCMTVAEYLPNGDSCWNATFCDTILIECDACSVDAIPIRTGYDYANNTTYPIGASDPNWRWNPVNVAAYQSCQTMLPTSQSFKPAFLGTEYFANTDSTQHGNYDVKYKFCLPDSFDCQQLHFNMDVRVFPKTEFRINGYPIPTSFIDSAFKSAHINYLDKNWSYTPSAADCAHFKPGANIINLRMKKYRSEPLLDISGTITQTGGQPILMNGDCCEWPEDDDCNCEKFNQEVAAGFMKGGIALSQLCRRSFNPKALQHCDLVEWIVDGNVVANTTANHPFSYFFTDGIHEVCMNVTRVTNTGSTCTDSYCQNVTINCSIVSPPLPPIAPHNFGFDSNSTEGVLGQLGKTDFWQPSSGEPYIKQEPGCFDDWDLILSSNLTQKDAVHQEVVLLQGNTYKPEIYASYYYPLKDSFVMPRILLLASKTYQDAVEGCTQDCEIVGEYDQPLPIGEWQHIEWPNWTPSETFNYLTVMLEYPVDDDGTDETRCFVVVDNISLDIVNGSNEVEIGGVRLSPNPTSGHFSLYFNKPTSSNTFLKIMGLRGEVLKTHTLPIGKIQHGFSIAELPAGAYILKIEDQDGHLWAGKIVKQ